MAIGYFLRVGDKTTCGGQILTGDNTMQWYGVAGAREGDLVSCGKHSGKYYIIGGISSMWLEDRKHAGTLDSFSSCPCKSRIINSIQDCYSKEDELISRSYSPVTTETPIQQPISQPSNHYAPPIIANDNKIRIDAQHLIDCADELCEKHLYYPEVKSEFKSDVENFAYQIVDQVESGQKSYEQGSAELKQEEKSLREQAFDLISNGLSILRGIAMTGVGIGLCSTGLGCLIGAPLIAHGVNGIYEGGVGIYQGDSNIQGPLREGYKATAKLLGFNESVGNLAYDLIDLGISISGKLKLIPKLNEYGNPNKNLFFKEYVRKDLEYAYKQLSNRLLMVEIVSDSFSLLNIKDDIKNMIVLDKENNHISLVINEPEKISNVKEIVDNCYTAMLIAGNGTDDSPSKILVCSDKDGKSYYADLDGTPLD
ncbi:hypothetical protein PROVRUST_06392 [Providencia rustigianii DSM 4541]|uniref:PAAR domain protein n=2 Tax=Providencia rustigianii TaxID=158850 RepID=D1P2G8_9GAMM|nr:DUF4225 domain-containing protein [Providencia rustigianii]EFB72323.1 hypothetical protein PROVRUST_06392 [Providencia rustigianii DSM 4541]SUC28698.1 Pyocin large subunit [Providencia rustigianii]